MLKDLIECLRLRYDGAQPTRNGHSINHDYQLNNGTFPRMRESRAGWSKLPYKKIWYIPMATSEGLDNQLQWPNGQHRAELTN